MVLIVKSV